MPQVLWIQTGHGRRSVSWGVISKSLIAGQPNAFVNLGSNIAVGYIWAKAGYMMEHEYGKYPFMRPVVEAWVRKGRIRKQIADEIKQVL